MENMWNFLLNIKKIQLSFPQFLRSVDYYMVVGTLWPVSNAIFKNVILSRTKLQKNICLWTIRRCATIIFNKTFVRIYRKTNCILSIFHYLFNFSYLEKWQNHALSSSFKRKGFSVVILFGSANFLRGYE